MERRSEQTRWVGREWEAQIKNGRKRVDRRMLKLREKEGMEEKEKDAEGKEEEAEKVEEGIEVEEDGKWVGCAEEAEEEGQKEKKEDVVDDDRDGCGYGKGWMRMKWGLSSFPSLIISHPFHLPFFLHLLSSDLFLLSSFLLFFQNSCFPCDGSE